MRTLVWSNRAIISRLAVPCEDVAARQHAGHRDRALTTRELLRRTSVREVSMIIISGCLVAGIVASLVSIVVTAVLLIGVVLCFVGVVARRARARASAIDRDLPVLLTSVASSVRAGIDPLKAIIDSQEYLPADSPLAQEVSELRHRLVAGEDEVCALEGLLKEDANRDVELFKQCMILSRKHGTSLSEPLHRVVKVVRQRHSFMRKTRAALAMHKMSSLGIVMCAIAIALMQLGMNPSGVRAAIDDPRGIVLLSVGLFLILAGVCWMARMGRQEAV